MGQLLFFGCSALVVRFLSLIGQLQDRTCAACPILPHYRTTSGPDACCLSDSSALSDNSLFHRERKHHRQHHKCQQTSDERP